MRLSPTLRQENTVRERLLADCTTMGVGGPATLVVVEQESALAEIRSIAHRWIGKGANLLIGDEGVPEPVIRFGQSFAECTIDELPLGGGRVRVGAAHDLSRFVATCARAGLAGPEGLAGVPATVGGALWMNAGTRTVWIFDILSRVRVWLPDEPQPRWLERDEVPATYRGCGLPPGTIMLAAEFDLPPSDPKELQAAARGLRQKKAATQPLKARSAGCMFKNPSPDLAAGKVVDDLGLKGVRHGGAFISDIHGNFIVNDDGATCADVAHLVRLMRHRAWNELGVILDLEVQTWHVPQDLHVHPSEQEAVE